MLLCFKVNSGATFVKSVSTEICKHRKSCSAEMCYWKNSARFHLWVRGFYSCKYCSTIFCLAGISRIPVTNCTWKWYSGKHNFVGLSCFLCLLKLGPCVWLLLQKLCVVESSRIGPSVASSWPVHVGVCIDDSLCIVNRSLLLNNGLGMSGMYSCRDCIYS